MKITIDIPKEFEKHFGNDRFKDSLERIKADLDDEFVFAGLYERELLEMLIEAFKNAEKKKIGYWKGDGTSDMCCLECGETPGYEQGMSPEATNYCPNCGAEMKEGDL